jgi:hypothetical protein
MEECKGVELTSIRNERGYSLRIEIFVHILFANYRKF